MVCPAPTMTRSWCREDTAEELEGMLPLDHQQRPVAPVPPRYPVAGPAAAAGRPASRYY